MLRTRMGRVVERENVGLEFALHLKEFTIHTMEWTYVFNVVEHDLLLIEEVERQGSCWA